MNQITLIYKDPESELSNFFTERKKLIDESIFFRALLNMFPDQNEFVVPIEHCNCNDMIFSDIIKYINREYKTNNIIEILLPYYNLFAFKKYSEYLELADYLCMNSLIKLLMKNIDTILKNQHLFTAIGIYENDIDLLVKHINENKGFYQDYIGNFKLSKKYIGNKYQITKYINQDIKKIYVNLYTINDFIIYNPNIDMISNLSIPIWEKIKCGWNMVDDVTLKPIKNPVIAHKRNIGDKIITPFENFKNKLDQYTHGLLKYIPFHNKNIVYSGGSLYDIVTNNCDVSERTELETEFIAYTLDDKIDLDIFATKAANIEETLRYIIKLIIDDNKMVKIVYKAHIFKLYIYDQIPENNDENSISSDSDFENKNPPIQIIFSHLDNIEKIINTFDASHVKMYYDGNDVFISGDCIHGLINGCSHVYQMYMSRSKKRIGKIYKRNLQINNCLPNADIHHYFSNSHDDIYDSGLNLKNLKKTRICYFAENDKITRRERFFIFKKNFNENYFIKFIKSYNKFLSYVTSNDVIIDAYGQFILDSEKINFDAIDYKKYTNPDDCLVDVSEKYEGEYCGVPPEDAPDNYLMSKIYKGDKWNVVPGFVIYFHALNVKLYKNKLKHYLIIDVEKTFDSIKILKKMDKLVERFSSYIKNLKYNTHVNKIYNIKSYLSEDTKKRYTENGNFKILIDFDSNTNASDASLKYCLRNKKYKKIYKSASYFMDSYVSKDEKLNTISINYRLTLQ